MKEYNDDNTSIPKDRPRKTGIVEDDVVYREFVTVLLRQMPEVEFVNSWASAEAMRADRQSQEVELLFVDLELPGLGGLELISQLNQMVTPPLSVVLTSSRAAEDVFTAVRNGASGYLIKSGDPQTFQDSLKEIIHDGVSLSPEIARLLVAEFRRKAPGRPSAGWPQPLESLTNREREVLNGLAKLGSAKGVASSLHMSHETVRVHMKKIYRKLHVNSKSEALALLACDGG